MTDDVTLITGTRKGIGRHLAERYLAQGHRVIGCSRQPSDLTHPSYRHFELDVTAEDSVLALFTAVRREFGHVTNLINNAGIASMNHSLLTPTSTLRRVLETNLIASFTFSREAAKLMRARKRGRIVNFSTVAVAYSLEGEAAYVASKAGLEGLTRVLAREFGAFEVTVNAVGPTPIDTDLIRNVPKDKIDGLIARQALRRLGTFEDVANVVDFFLAPSSHFVTGQVLYLGGA
jgi:3-oxoacyl-[acyl-carrier protein] reductase